MAAVGVRRRGTIGQAKLPIDAAGLVGWWKADAIQGLADGAAVASWPDSSGRGRTLVQGTGAAQPLFKTAIQNGLPVVRFDGVNDVMLLAAVFTSIPQPFSVALVFAATVGDGGYIGFLNNVGAPYIQRTAANVVQIHPGTTLTPAVADAAGFDQWSCDFNGASSAIKLNGGAPSVGGAGASVMNYASFGGANGGSPIAMDLAEMIFRSGASLASDAAYLKAKWGTP